MALNREQVIRTAEKYVSKGKLEAAIKEYRKVLAENPNDANTLNRVGDLYARIERFDEAVKLFSQIAEQYTQDGFFVKAIAIYKKIIKLDPTSLPVYERLAELYYKQGLLNEARTQYQVLADYYQKHDNAASAITIYQRMTELEPDNPTFHLKLAELYVSQRLTDKAVRAYRMLADLMITSGSVDEAVQVYAKALEVSSDPGLARELISGLQDGGHAEAAARLLGRAVELDPAAARLAQELGRPTADAPVKPAPAASAWANERPFVAAPVSPSPAPVEPTFTAPPVFDDFDVAEEPEFDFSAGDADESASLTNDDHEVFTFDLDDDEIPDTLVTPPPDMLDAPLPHRAGMAEEEEFEFVIDGFDDEPAGEEIEPELVTAVEVTDVEVPEGTAELAVDWSLDAMDLEIPETVVELAESVPLPRPEEDLEATFAVGPLELEFPEEEPEEVSEVVLEEDEEFFTDAPFLDEPEVFPAELSAPDLAAPAAPEVFDAEEGELAEIDAAEFALGDFGDETLADVDLLPFAEAAEDAEEEEAEPARELVGVAQTTARREEDLLAEAKVFAKYGLREKAQDRLYELLEVRPQHLEGLQLLTRIDLQAGRQDEVIYRANQVAQLAVQAGNLEPWHELREQLVEAGYDLDGDRVTGEPGRRPEDDNRIAQLLEDLNLAGYASSPASATAVEIALEPPQEPVVAASGIAPPAAPASGVPGSASGPRPSQPLISLVDELQLDELDDVLDDELEAFPQATSATLSGSAAPLTSFEPPPVDPLDETGMSWLDDVESEEPAAAGTEETIFDEEDDFFDLAAELERELTEDELESGLPETPQEQSLEEIVEGFKRGVAENLSPQDYDTHFNLGIAYREMGLLDEAIGEFQLASKDDRFLVDCSSMLGQCFLEKGLPELAVRWYKKGLESPLINEDATLGLLYEMGTAYLSLGDPDAAYRTFVEIYGMNSHYRDVAVKIHELGGLR